MLGLCEECGQLRTIRLYIIADNKYWLCKNCRRKYGDKLWDNLS